MVKFRRASMPVVRTKKPKILASLDISSFSPTERRGRLEGDREGDMRWRAKMGLRWRRGDRREGWASFRVSRLAGSAAGEQLSLR